MDRADAEPGEFTLRGPEDFLRLDGRCAELLQGFRDWLLSPEGGALEPRQAGALAHAADRFLRDFVVDILETGPADASPDAGRRYLANWYLVNTLEPSHQEIDRIGEALGRLYPYLVRRGVVAPAAAASALAALGDPAHFHRRLESFWELTPDTIAAWRRVDDYRRPRPLR